MTSCSTQPAAGLHLVKVYKHRDEPIKKLSSLLSHDRVPDILVYGPSCTGKTSIVRWAHVVDLGETAAHVVRCRDG